MGKRRASWADILLLAQPRPVSNSLHATKNVIFAIPFAELLMRFRKGISADMTQMVNVF